MKRCVLLFFMVLSFSTGWADEIDRGNQGSRGSCGRLLTTAYEGTATIGGHMVRIAQKLPPKGLTTTGLTIGLHVALYFMQPPNAEEVFSNPLKLAGSLGAAELLLRQ